MSALLISLNSLNAQVESILDIQAPTGLFYNNDSLYIGTFNGEFVKWSLNSSEDLELLQNSSVFRIAKHKNNLYYTDGSGTNIFRIDLDSDLISLVFIQDDPMAGVAVFNDTLYYSEWFGGEIHKINLNESPLNSEVLHSGLDTLNAMEVYNGNLYFIENTTGGIFRTDLTKETPTVDTLFFGEFVSPNELYTINDYMYVSDFLGDRVSRFNLKEANPQIETVIENIIFPTGLTSDDNFLYISSFEGDQIFRFQLDIISSIEDNSNSTQPLLYPIPNNGILTVSNIENEEEYRIININGQIIQSGTIRNGHNIILESTSEKIYFVQIGRSPIRKIVAN